MAILRRLCSLKFTVVLLLLSLILVFVGTLAQVKIGIFRSQEVYFESFFLWREVFGYNLPVLPAGYTIGGLLLVNLLASFFGRFRLKGKHAGLLCVHFGLIVLLLGEVLTDLFSVESQMRLAEGESKNYSESIFDYELAVVRETETGQRVVGFPSVGFDESAILAHAESPVDIEVIRHWPNSMLRSVASGATPLADAGIGQSIAVIPLSLTGKMDERNVPSVLVDVRSGVTGLGRYLLSGHMAVADTVTLPDESTIELSLRPKRYYMDSNFYLTDFVREVYLGTNKPSHFESKLVIEGGENAVPRETNVYMNHPLRYDGKTFYQASFAGGETISILQVVQNPTWFLPYASCGLITLGLCWQSVTRIQSRRRVAA